MTWHRSKGINCAHPKCGNAVREIGAKCPVHNGSRVAPSQRMIGMGRLSKSNKTDDELLALQRLDALLQIPGRTT